MAVTVFNSPVRLNNFQVWTGKACAHLLITGALIWQFLLGFSDNLGADPVQSLLDFTGKHAVHLLLFTLCLAPLARYTPCGDFIRYRRMIGVYTFVYALAHFSTYILFELQLNWPLIGSELIERPYISVGFVALLILLALAATSFNVIRRKMGRSWQSLHNWVYAAILLALLHFSWSQKTIWEEPIFYWIAAFIILLPRLQYAIQSQTKKRKRRKTA